MRFMKSDKARLEIAKLGGRIYDCDSLLTAPEGEWLMFEDEEVAFMFKFYPAKDKTKCAIETKSPYSFMNRRPTARAEFGEATLRIEIKAEILYGSMESGTRFVGLADGREEAFRIAFSKFVASRRKMEERLKKGIERETRVALIIAGAKFARLEHKFGFAEG